MKHRFPYAAPMVLAAVVFGVFASMPSVCAQVQVELKIDRTLYILYEPLIATVSVSNLSGRELRLADEGRTPWFGFQVTSNDGRPMPPRHGIHRMDPVFLAPGETIRRQMNLTPIYPFDQFGGYRVRATVHDATSGQFYSSNSQLVEITDGRVLWQREVGVPEDGSTRVVTLLSHRLPNSTGLYLRIMDKGGGKIYCTHRLGRLVAFGPPEVELDLENGIHVLQMRAPKNYLYSYVDLDGEVIERSVYQGEKERPQLRRDPGGIVAVVGGEEYDPTQPTFEESVASISERPVPLPDPTESQAAPTPQRGMFDFLKPRESNE